MSRANDPAHPTVSEPSGAAFNGLTIREHFAGLAMQGLMVRSHLATNSEAAVAVLAVSHADALLAELAKPVKS